MRRSGLADSPGDVGLDGHACWGYHSAVDFAALAGPFLDEGLRRAQRLMFVGGSEAEEVVRSVEPMRSMVRDGAVLVLPFEELFPGGHRMAPDRQLAAFAEATERAVADGFRGLRLLAEVTALAVPVEEAGEHAAWEALADRYMASRPLAALCCFDRRVLDDQALAPIACVHPVADARLRSWVPFQVYAQPDAVALAGEVDALSAELLEEALLWYDDGGRSDVVLELENLTFIDHRGLIVLCQYAGQLRRQGRTLTLRHEPPILHRMSGLLGMSL